MTETDEGAAATRCFVCYVDLVSAFRDGDGEVQRFNATLFEARGNYGSTVWDMVPAGESLLINVCDDCLVRLAHLVTHAEVSQPRSVTTYTNWHQQRNRPGRGAE